MILTALQRGSYWFTGLPTDTVQPDNQELQFVSEKVKNVTFPQVNLTVGDLSGYHGN